MRYIKFSAVCVIVCILLSVSLAGCAGSDTPTGASVDFEATQQEGLDPAPAPTDAQEETSVEAPPDETSQDSADTDGTEDTEGLIWGIFPLSFTAQDLYGNTVTEESIGEKQLFFIHFWATWCPPCVGEMPELAALAEEYGDRVGFIGLIEDYDSNLEGAINITESSGIPESFIMVDARLPEMSDLLLLVQSDGVPTSVIVAADGRMSEQIIGAYGSVYADILDSILG